MSNQCVLFFTDNESLVPVINKQTSKDSDLMTFVRTMVLVCLQNNILFKVQKPDPKSCHLKNSMIAHADHAQIKM